MGRPAAGCPRRSRRRHTARHARSLAQGGGAGAGRRACSASPTDVAVYALSGRAGGVYGGVVGARRPSGALGGGRWSSPPRRKGFVAGGGFMPLTRMVDVAGGAAATTASGAGSRRRTWTCGSSLDKDALRMALSAAEPALAGQRTSRPIQGHAGGVGRYGRARKGVVPAGRRAGRESRASPLRDHQHRRLHQLPPGLRPHPQRSRPAERDLAGVAPSRVFVPEVGVCAVAVLVQTCRGGRVWRVDPEAAARLRRALGAAALLPSPGGR